MGDLDMFNMSPELNHTELITQLKLVDTIIRENPTVRSYIRKCITAILRHGLHSSDEAYLRKTHNYWEQMIRKSITELLGYGYVVATIRVVKIQHEQYIVPDIISGTRYVIVPHRKKKWMLHFKYEEDERMPCHVFWLDEPKDTGELTSHVMQCRYTHEYQSNLLACDAESTEVNCQSRGIVCKDVKLGPPTHFDLLGETTPNAGSALATIPSLGKTDPVTYYAGNIQAAMRITDFHLRQVLLRQREKNMMINNRKAGMASTSLRPANDFGIQTFMDDRLQANSHITDAPKAVPNPKICDLLQYCHEQIAQSMGMHGQDSDSNVQSADALFIKKQQMDEAVEPIRFKIEQMLEVISECLIEAQEKKEKTTQPVPKQGVWLGKAMAHTTLHELLPFLTLQARKKYIAEVYNISEDEVDGRLLEEKSLTAHDAVEPTAKKRRVEAKSKSMDV